MKGGIFLNIGSYEINNETLVIMPFGKNQSKVYEISGDFIVNMSPLNIIKASCLYFGSSYEGRKESAKYTAGIEMKVPVLIEESRNIIFFPLKIIARYWICKYLMLYSRTLLFICFIYSRVYMLIPTS